MEELLQVLYPEYIDTRAAVRLSMCSHAARACVFDPRNNTVRQTMCMRVGVSPSSSPYVLNARLNRKNSCDRCLAATRCVYCVQAPPRAGVRLCTGCSHVELVDRVSAAALWKVALLEHGVTLSNKSVLKRVRQLTRAKKRQFAYLFWRCDVADSIQEFMRGCTSSRAASVAARRE